MANHTQQKIGHLADTGERMIPPAQGEVSVVFSRHPFTYQYVRQFVNGKDVLDIGCGTGYGSHILAEHARSVLGLDYDQDAIDYCRTHYRAQNIIFQHADAATLSIKNKFDVAVSFQVIEHMHHVEDFIDRIKSAVKQNGFIIITTPNVKTTNRIRNDNPFHCHEMSYEQFDHLISDKFKSYRILGISHAAPNWIRSIIGMFPFYRRIGLLLKRTSRIKKAAAQVMDLTRYNVFENDVQKNAIDLLAICKNEPDVTCR